MSQSLILIFHHDNLGNTQNYCIKGKTWFSYVVFLDVNIKFITLFRLLADFTISVRKPFRLSQ